MVANPIIMKFGGTSVADTEAFERVAQIVKSHRDESPVVVVSAISKFTDTLLRCLELAIGNNVTRTVTEFEIHLARHTVIAETLLASDEASKFATTVDDFRRKLTRLLCDVASSDSIPALKDELLAVGEQLSACLLTRVLRANGLPATYVDARRVIITDEQFGCAEPLMKETADHVSLEVASLIRREEIPVLGGFIAGSARGTTTTLGRGGSDYSAAIVGAALNAREIQIWTDVTGVLTADPRVVANARTVPVLSYQEAAELAYFGAKVLHPKTMHPAVECNIPVRVCNSQAPTEPGTLVRARSEAVPQTVKAIAHKNNITTLQVTSSRMLGAYGFLRALFEVFDRHRTVVDVVTTSEVSVSLSVDDASSLPQLLPDLEKFGTVEVEHPRTIICIIGEGLRHTPGIAARLFGALSDINISMISFGSSSINLTFMVDEEFASETITRLHRVCFEEKDQSAGITIENAPEEIAA